MGRVNKDEIGAKGRRKPKKKNANRATNSNMSSTRRLSRMGKEQKKGLRGAAAAFITRNQALNKLGSITLRDFRRLCILKGIHPREPKNKKLKGKSGVTYYHVKDISFLSHEPILKNFREFKTVMKKVRKCAGRNNTGEAQNLYQNREQYTLHHIVRERYPTFQDALRDMDDALCMAHLFAQMQAVGTIQAKRTQMCQRLCREWQLIVTKQHTLRKTFISVKGIYYQAEIQGQPISWVVPHTFTQTKPRDVDFRIMSTFLEFYEVMLKFVLFKLYHNANLKYPPAVRASSIQNGAHLTAMSLVPTATASEAGAVVKPKKKSLKTAQLPISADSIVAADVGKAGTATAAKEKETASEATEQKQMEEVFKGNVEAEQLAQLGKRLKAYSSLFKGFRFFIGRECPRESLEFVLAAYGADVVGWEDESSLFDADHSGITHCICDRPAVRNRVYGREYVQPQWVYDSANTRLLLPVHAYAAGAKLPPHLSPFVKDNEEGYVPKYRMVLLKLQADAGDQQAKETLAKLKAAEEDEEADADPEQQEMQELAKSMMGKKKRILHSKMMYGKKKKASAVKALKAKRRKLETASNV